MPIIFIFYLMVFLHIVDDFYLQGILAQMKQRSWWEENCPEAMYKNDYRVALILHGFSWSFMIMLPIFIYFNFETGPMPYFIFAINWIIHSFVDDLKANEKVINLETDQIIHIFQIIFTFIGVFYFN